MEIPLQIEFQGMEGVEPVRSAITRHVTEFERRFGRLTACRVVLKSPSGRHRTGGRYELNIHLALLDGREVNIDRPAAADRKSTRLNSSHQIISYAVFCLKKKKKQ